MPHRSPSSRLAKRLPPPPRPVPASISSSPIWHFALADALVLARPELEVLFGLNPTAEFLWRQFVSPHSVTSAAQSLSNQFEIPLSQAEQDTQAAFQSFSEFVSLAAPVPPGPVSKPTEAPFFSATYVIQNVRFCLNLSSEALAQEIAPRLIALQVPDAEPHYTFSLHENSDGVSLFRNGVRFAKEPLVTGSRALLLQELTRLAVPKRDFRAILHAGAVGTPNACVILAGASLCGKSTLCYALMQAGLLCYSDDSACLTPDFQVAGMPFALAMREGERFRPSNLNGHSPAAPPVALIFVNYQPGAPVSLEPLAGFEAFLKLQQSGFWVEHTEPSIGSFLRWLLDVPRYQLTYSALAEGISAVTALLA
jgi:hypothetical protein